MEQAVFERTENLYEELQTKVEHLFSFVFVNQNEGVEFVINTAKKHLTENELNIIEAESKKYFKDVKGVFSGLNAILQHVTMESRLNNSVSKILFEYGFEDIKNDLKDKVEFGGVEGVGHTLLKSLRNDPVVTDAYSLTIYECKCFHCGEINRLPDDSCMSSNVFNHQCKFCSEIFPVKYTLFSRTR